MENVVIQALQFSRLMMLASAFGHWWARVLHEADPGRKVWTTSDIAAAQAAARAAEEKALAAASASLASAWKMAEWAEMRRPPPLLPVRKWKTRYV